LLYDSAARISEIAGATLGDLELDSGAPHVTLTGKGRKTRIMPIMAKTAEHLRVYLDEFHPGPRPDPATPMFYSTRQGQPCPLSTDTIDQTLKTAANIARPTCPDIPARVHCHLIRKTRAMNLYQDGIPLPLIMQMLGHESMTTTSGFYAFATNQMMAEAIQSANPQAIKEPPNWKTQTTIDTLYSL
jgi:integrase